MAKKEKILSWKPPQAGYVKLNFNGAIFQDLGVAGVGIVLRNDQGVVLFAASRKEIGGFSVDDIEVMATLKSLWMISQLGFQNLQLEGDLLIFFFKGSF